MPTTAKHCCGVSILLMLALAGTIPAQAQLRYPLSAVAAESGAIFVADRDLHGIWRIADSRLAVFFEGTPKYRTPLNSVRCVTLDGQGRVLAGDSSTREVYRFSEDGQPTPLTQGGIGIPMDLVVTKAGDLLVSDLELHRVVRVPGGKGEPAVFAEIKAPRGLYLDADERLWVVSGGPQGQLLRLSTAGETDVVVAGRPFEFPHDVVVDADGTAFVSDGYARSIWKVPAGGAPQKWVSGDPLLNPVGLTWQGEDLLVVDSKAKAVFRITPDGEISPLGVRSD